MATATFVLDVPQADGKRRVIETHTDDFGVVERIEYGPVGAGVDYAAVAAARSSQVVEQKRQSEIAQNISAITNLGSLAELVFKYSTKAENIGPLRDAYRHAGREICIMIADYLATLTDAQLRNIFGKTQAQVDTLRANKLTPAIDLANKIRNAGGE